MNVKADQATFTWSEGPASFAPYKLDGMVYKEFKEIAAKARKKLADLVKDYLHYQQGMPKSAFELAEAGHELYQAIFDPGAEQARQARQVREWLEVLTQQCHVETLEIVVASPWSLPWNVIYDQKPVEPAFLANNNSPDRWKPFWGLRYNLAGGRKVDPLRRMPLLKDPKVLMVVDPKTRGGLPAEQQQRLADFVKTHKLKMVHSKNELQAAITADRPNLLYWFSHASADALVLDGEEISPPNIRKLLRQGNGASFGGLAFLNACQTAQGGESESFFEAFHSVGFAGMIGTEHQTVDRFANSLGLDFLEAFLDDGKPIGSALHKLRERVPLGLLYGTYCPPDIRVDRVVVALNAEPASDESATRPLPPLPDEPYRSLAYYDRNDRALFAGRDDDIERFATMLDDASTRMLVLHGESGVGKSSFLHAGVIPYVEEECLGYRFIRERAADEAAGAQGAFIFIRATNDLFGQLAKALCEFCARPYEYQTPQGEQVSVDLPGMLSKLICDVVNELTVRAKLRSEPALLGQVLAAISNCLPFTAILVIDQGEEVFTLAQTPEDQQRGRQALDMLRRTVETEGNFKVIFALRTEYYGRVIDRLRRGLHDAGRIREYLLTDFDEDHLLEAIRRPTVDARIPYASEVPFAKYGFRYAEGVAEKIADRVVHFTTQHRDSVLPLMQIICAELYRLTLQRADKAITLADLEKLGGIEGGMRNHVDRLLAELLKDRSLDKRSVQQLFTQLYLKQPDGTLTTALLPEDEFRKRWTGRLPFDELLRTSLAMRLLRVNTLRIGMEEERRYVSLGHDALAQLAAHWEEELARSERARRMWRQVAFGISAAVVLALSVIFIVYWFNAKSVVADVKEAPPNKLLQIIRDVLPYYRRWIDPDLLAAANGMDGADEKQQLNARLALDCIRPPSDARLGELWRKLRNDDTPDDDLAKQARFYAALALVFHVPDTKDWSEDDLKFVADYLVASNVDYQQEFRKSLDPIGQKLLKPLQDVFADATRRGGERTSAAKALAEFAKDDPVLLAELACEATPDQYGIIYEKLAASGTALDKARSELEKMIEKQPTADLSEEKRVSLGSRRATAAITLIRLEQPAAALDVFRIKDDPEALTQFVHGCKDRGLRAAELIECLKSDATDDSTRFGLLLALGEFDLKELTDTSQTSIVKELAESYRSDPSSAIHSVTSWLLRHWRARTEELGDPVTPGLKEALTVVDEVDHTALPYDPARDWFVVEVKSEFDGQPCADYFTFIVFQPGEFEMGSPDNEPYREPGERRHHVRLTRAFAICDREVTNGQLGRFFTTERPPDYLQRSPSSDHPAIRVSWNQAVSYCRWLTRQAGLDESEQCYADPEGQELRMDGFPQNWAYDFSKAGFRLPTEAEWEFACRAGTITAYSFGNDWQLLKHYAWFLDNASGTAQPVGRKQPNLRGLFDVHGNVWEWCHDWLGDYDDNATDPDGSRAQKERVVRSGSWYDDYRRACRSAYRYRMDPANDNNNGAGFRLVLVPFSPKKQKRAEPEKPRAEPEKPRADPGAAAFGAGDGGAQAP